MALNSGLRITTSKKLMSLSQIIKFMQVDQSSYNEAFYLRENLRLPLKLCQILDYQQSVIKQALTPKKRRLITVCCSTGKKKKRYFVDNQFIATFDRMTIQQKMKLYVKSVRFLKRISDGNLESQIQIEHLSFQKVLIKGGNLGDRWAEYTLNLNIELGTLEIKGKDSGVIDLHEYLIRSSNYRKMHAFVLQAIQPGFSQIFRIGFQDQIQFQKCFRAVSLLVDKCLFENLKKEIQNVKQFRMPSRGFQVLPFQIAASKSERQNGEQLQNLLTSYIQKQIKPFCVSDGLIPLSQFDKKFKIIDPQMYQQNSLFPLGIKEEELYDIQNYSSTSQYGESLQQFKKDPLIFRMNKVYDHSIESIVSCFSDADFFSSWNKQIKDASVISGIQSQNCLIISQVHKPLVKYYEARIFTYLRMLFSKDNCIYIVDRPIICLNKPQLEHFIKGTFEFGVWKLASKGTSKTIVDGLVKLNHKMIKNPDIQIRLTGMYMDGYLNINQYLSTNQSRFVDFLDLKYRQSKFKKLIQILYKEPSLKQNIPQTKVFSATASKKKQQPRKIPIKFEQDSFYSAVGGEDWGSRMAYSKSSIKDFGKDRQKQFTKTVKILNQPQIIPIIQISSPNVSGSSQAANQSKPMLVKLHSNSQVNFDTKTFNKKSGISVPISKEKISTNPNKPSNTMTSSKLMAKQQKLIVPTKNKHTQQEIYNHHIVQTFIPNLDSEGYCIVPQFYLRQPFPFPMIPKKDYFYKIMKGTTWNHYLLKDIWIILPNGQLKCTNAEILKAQNGVFASICKKAATNVFTGKGLNMSLPVEVFSELSLLQLIARGMCFAPLFLQKASKSSEALQRLKLAICFSLGFSLAYLQMSKPFNPILGQTFQGWINGCPLYCQQVSHHPAISSYLMIGRGYRVYGNITPEIQLSMNSGIGYNAGQCVIQFDRFPDHKIYIRSPGGEIHGLTYGDRKFNFIGKGFYYDNMSHYCQIPFHPYKKSMFSFGKQQKQTDIVQGNIYKVNKQQIVAFRKKFTKEGISKKLLKNPISVVSGRYTEQVLFDNVQYFDVIKDEPCCYQQQAFPLASNCNYREDIIYKRKNDCNRAQKQKERLQQLQRKEKKLRH